MQLHRPIARLVLAAGAFAIPAGITGAQSAYSAPAQVVPFSAQELDNLVAPIALYPDAILAQVLVAATFPDQIEFAVRYVRANGTRGIDDQPWDVSVKAVAYYLPVLNMLGERPDWTIALGQAYAIQSSDVMDAVQRLRAMAHAQGNLVSTPQQEVIVERERIVIVPAQPRVIYVPTYDPWAVYYRPVFFASGYRGYWSFGIGFPIGAWLIYDCDWYGRRVYYDGWRGGGWRRHSRPYIHITNVYVHPRYEVVYVNRTVVHHTVNYVNLTRYNSVHRETSLAQRGRGGRDDDRGVGRRDDDRRDDGGRGGRATDGQWNGAVPDRSAVQESPVGGIRASRADAAGGGTVKGSAPPVAQQRARPVGQPAKAEQSVTTQRPVQTQPPAQAQRPVTTQRPVQTQPPVQAQRPVTTQRPVQTQPPVQAQRPAQGKTPVQSQRSVPAQRPVQAQPPAQAQRPAKTQQPVATQRPASKPPAAAQRQSTPPAKDRPAKNGTG